MEVVGVLHKINTTQNVVDLKRIKLVFMNIALLPFWKAIV